jgi:signal peptide peptidase SppA
MSEVTQQSDGGANVARQRMELAVVAGLMLNAPLLMVEATHAEFLRQRFVGRPVSRPSSREEEKRGPESVAKFPNAAATGGYGYSVDAAGVAIVSIKGVITPEAWAWYDNMETISDWVVRDVTAMTADPAVKRALFVIDSPGGYVAGSFEMADAIDGLADAKPAATICGSYCTSAAYLQAVQTDWIVAFKTSIVGSIGTRSAVIDASKLFADWGVKMIPIDSGGMKSAGLIGTEITQDQIDYFRSTVLQLQALFTAEVADGRGVSIEQAQKWADGRVFVAADAKAMGLINQVGSQADAYAKLLTMKPPAPDGARAEIPTTEIQPAAGAAGGGTESQAEAANRDVPDATGADANNAGEQSSEKGTDMSQTTNPAPGNPATEPKAATMAEFKAACPGASSDFLVECSEKGMTVPQAKDAFIGWQAAQIRTRDEELTKAKQSTTAAPAAGATQPKKPGVPALASEAAERSTAGAAGGDAIAAFGSAVEEQMKKPGFDDRKKAIAAVCRSKPQLHQEYLEATNKGRKQRELIADRFGS